MKFNINEIPQAGLALAEDFNAKDWDIEVPTVKFAAPVHVEAFVTNAEDEVYVSAKIKGKMVQECARCLASFGVPLSMKLDFSYPVNGPKEIILDGDMRQEIMLTYPIKPLCVEGCKGLCPLCGQNLNEGKCEHLNK